MMRAQSPDPSRRSTEESKMHTRLSRTLRALPLALPIALAAVTLAASPARAEAPMVKTQAPGYYRTTVGAFEVTAISDGTVKLPVTKLLHGKPAKLSAALKRAYLGDEVETSVNAYLVNTGSKLVLIDAGAGGLFGPTLGKLLANIQAAGYQPSQVDEIYITHLHPDHVGGLAAGGALAFPNATLRLDKADADFWLSEANMNAAPADAKGFFQGAMASVNPYVKAGRLKTFEGDTELVPGIRAQATHGHTPGHNIYVIESQGQKLVLWGDLMHVAAVQFAEPGVTIQFDTDSKAAAKQRKKAYADAAKNGQLVGAAHLSFPGLGHLRKASGGSGYVFVPLNYSSLQ
jgi:glyoxylase-like metal-dependent hydrolase (beta-lactamase superfamily II)